MYWASSVSAHQLAQNEKYVVFRNDKAEIYLNNGDKITEAAYNVNF